MTHGVWPKIPILKSGLTAKCPRCGIGPLFEGFLAVTPQCKNCGLNFSNADSADGPAAFAILIVGFAVVFSALYVEVTYRPPYWVHAALWLPAIVIGSLAVLRPLKAILTALQYHHHQFDDHDPE